MARLRDHEMLKNTLNNAAEGARHFVPENFQLSVPFEMLFSVSSTQTDDVVIKQISASFRLCHHLEGLACSSAPSLHA